MAQASKTTPQFEIYLFAPYELKENEDIANVMKRDITVIINVKKLSKNDAIRLTDYLDGVACAQETKQYIVGNDVIMYPSRYINVGGSINIE